MRNALIAVLLLCACSHDAYVPHAPVLAPDGSVNEGAVAISPVDARVAVAAGIRFTGGMSKVETWHSRDLGATWTAVGALPLIAGSRVLKQHWDPVLLFDRTGTAYITVVGAPPEGPWTIAVFRSTDGGATWSGVDAANNTKGNADKPWLAIDNSGGPFDGSLYLTWFTFGGGVPAVMHVARSRDRGVTWTEANGIAGASGWPFIAVGADGSVYASFFDAIANRIATVRSADGGVTFGAPAGIAPERTLVSGAIGYGTSAHQMAADLSSRPTRGNLYVVFPCASDGANSPPSSVCFTRSLDQGATWLASTRLSLPTQEAGLPNVAIDPLSGEVLLTWIARDVNSNDATLFATHSLDGGTTFPSAQPVAGPFPSRQAAGDYNQSASFGAVRMAMFSDTNGHLSIARISYLDDPPPPAPQTQLPRRRAVR